ncbi:primosomal protein N' [Nesterenkonia alba]|uniref:primosomal protein N' family DNA-binding protein n=1 Tax=Nesterenkonia alba TaxID=515814 RepID=UPI0003B645D1|nr:primosomal protein N' [Nesterenkonia alba]
MTSADPEPPAGRATRQPLLDGLASELAVPPPLPAGTAERLPVAQVLLESPVPHLDRPFDYAVPAELDTRVVPGGRVKVRFSGREMSGWVLSRSAQPGTAVKLSPISKVVSALPLLDEEIRRLCEQVATRYAGVTSDVIRAAVPHRVVRVEREFTGLQPGWTPPAVQPSPVDDIPHSLQEFLTHLASAHSGSPAGPRAALCGVAGFGPGGWVASALAVVQAALVGGHGAVVVLPDQRDVQRMASLLREALGDEVVAELTADLGPTARFRSFLRLRYGTAQVAVGTRSAVFAPVQRLGVIIMVDDDETTLSEPRAPYHHAREVALLRTVDTGAAILFLSGHRSLEVQRLAERGWLAELTPPARMQRQQAPRVISTHDSYQLEHDPMARRARMPAAAYRTAAEGLTTGPVLIQVGRAGYVPAVLCSRCSTRQQCPDCSGPLSLPVHHQQSATLRCRWCGLHHRRHRCPECGGAQFRAGSRGADRTSHELGRAFPQVPVISSTSDHPVAEVGHAPALVVATPGLEPVAPTGYSAAVLLDGDARLSREGLDVPRQVLASWFRAAGLVRSQETSGAVVVTAADEELTAALVRWDPIGYARRELYRRLEVGLPPARRVLSVTGDATEAEELIARVRLPEGLEWIGPAPVEGGHRWLLFFSYAQAHQVIAEMRRVRRTASASPAGAGRALRVAVDDVASLQI